MPGVITLRPDQVDTLARVEEAYRRGIRRVLLVCPTGSGKTVMGAALARRATDLGLRVLWLTHRIELIAQSTAALERQGAHALVQSLDTLVSRGHFPSADLVIFDEAHHAAAATWGAFLAHYTEARVLGLTATPERGDGQGLKSAFDAIVPGPSVRELTDKGILVPLRVLRPRRPLRRGVIAAGVVDSYQRHAPDSRALVFSPSVELARQHARDFTDAGIEAEAVWGDMPGGLRADTIERFRLGRVRVLCNVNVLTEGFDVPQASCAILARGCSTIGAFDQIVGRIVRSSALKSEALLIDLRGQSHIHGLPVAGRVYSLDGQGIKSGEADTVSYCSVCGALKEPGEACAECGTAPEPATLRVVAEALKPYDFIAPMRSWGDAKKLKTLTGWVMTARKKGYKMGWVHGRYNACFGSKIPPALWAAAMAVKS
jgi:DNA repair protein RadD